MTKKPCIIVYSGPMFAGKSTSLINAYIDSPTPANNKVVFKYAKDTRYSNNTEIVTHNNVRIPCVMINECEDISTYLNNNACVNLDSNRITEIYIDECQFLPDILTWITGLQEINNTNTICGASTLITTIVLAGLDLDATGKPFTDAFAIVIETADVAYSLLAKCYVCSGEAPYTKLLKTDALNEMNKNRTNVLIGGAELY